jgi:hypothetical protein
MKSINISNVNLEIFKGESFCRAACWFDIVTLAAAEPESVFWNGKMLTLQPGEFLTSVRQLADRWSMSADHARSRLKEFVKCNLIKVARSASGIVITVLALCQKSSVNIRDSDTTDSHNCAKSDPLGSNLDEWFDELSIDLALRQELLEKHGITNWTNFRTEMAYSVRRYAPQTAVRQYRANGQRQISLPTERVGPTDCDFGQTLCQTIRQLRFSA